MEMEAARTIIIWMVSLKKKQSRGFSTFNVKFYKELKETINDTVYLNVWLIFERNFKAEGYIVTCLTSFWNAISFRIDSIMS